MTLLGLDLNASRARAVQGAMGDFPLALPLDPPAFELPLVLSLATARPEIGLQGVRLLRQLPHLTCHDFLVHLGTNGHSPRWKAGRHLLDADGAMRLVWQRLAPAFAKSQGVIASVPAYLSRPQADRLRQLGEEQKLRVLGTLPSLLTVALAGYAEQTWQHSTLVLDVDDHALSFGLVRAVDRQAHLLDMRHLPTLGLKLWKDRLVNALSDCCVLQSRRDPRDVPSAEQALYEQLDGLLDAGVQGRTLQLGIQGTSWYQNLLLSSEQIRTFCSVLLQSLMNEIEAFCRSLTLEETPRFVVLTAAAGRLPGVVQGLRDFMDEPSWRLRAVDESQSEEDFGEGLIDPPHGLPSVVVLSADSPARAAHGVGPLLQLGHLPRGHLEQVAPLPLPHPVDAGPPRLNFQGQDVYLEGPNFFVGSQTGCQLMLDGQRHPSVSPRHCEIVFDHKTYLLFNRSREGTWVNEQPVNGSAVLRAGDWIRLGHDGPQFRFLGHGGRAPVTRLGHAAV